MLTSQYSIICEPAKCTGCRRCQLICSFTNLGEFNISKANITIIEKDTEVENIIFTNNCKRCGTCVSYCVYGALKFEGTKQ